MPGSGPLRVGNPRPSTARWVEMIPDGTILTDRSDDSHRCGRSSAVAAVPLPRSSPAPRSCPGCGHRPGSVVERRVLAEELATTWLLFVGGRVGGTVVVRSFCRACVPGGPVAEVACAVCADGTLPAGELATGATRRVVEEWLVGQGWRCSGTASVGVVLGLRCAPVALTDADSPVPALSPAPDPELDDARRGRAGRPAAAHPAARSPGS